MFKVGNPSEKRRIPTLQRQKKLKFCFLGFGVISETPRGREREEDQIEWMWDLRLLSVQYSQGWGIKELAIVGKFLRRLKSGAYSNQAGGSF